MTRSVTGRHHEGTRPPQPFELAAGLPCEDALSNLRHASREVDERGRKEAGRGAARYIGAELSPVVWTFAMAIR